MIALGKLVFVGLGLQDERGISLRGIDEIRKVDVVFAEFYTNLMAGISFERLERLIGKRVSIVSRRALENESGKLILQSAMKEKVALLVPGDPLIATTHIELRIRAEKMGIKTHIIHGASIVSAVIGLTGLQNYKYGRSVTIPFSEDKLFSETPYRVIMENRERGLHTLCFLDVEAEEKRYMTINEGLHLLLSMEKRMKRRVITLNTLVVGIARAGSDNPTVKAGYIKEVITHEFGAPPQSLVFPGKLHFMEVEALITFAEAPRQLKEITK